MVPIITTPRFSRGHSVHPGNSGTYLPLIKVEPHACQLGVNPTALHSTSLPARLELPVREDDAEDDLMVRHLGYWLTGTELASVMEHGLLPRRDGDRVIWDVHDDPDAALLTDEHICRAYKESVAEYPKVFEMDENRKSLVCKRALVKQIAFNPTAVGMTARRVTTHDQRAFFEKREAGRLTPIAELLQMEKDGVRLRAQRYFPPTACRAPFSSIEEGQAAIRQHLGVKLAAGYSVPGLPEFQDAYRRGCEEQFDQWYFAINDFVRDGCHGNEHELRIFLSLLATASPNSSVTQNTHNALLNFRAISQDCRPKWGSYPARNLLNYLAGALGAPSGMKIRCFLDNLANPVTSQAVTIDTHMQRFVLGTGHLSLLPFEYAIIEDYYRCAAHELGILQPHSMQAAVWRTLAGPFSFRDELAKCIRRQSFHVAPCLPFPLTAAALGGKSRARRVAEAVQDARCRPVAEWLLRQKLLDIGYMSFPVPQGGDDPWKTGEVVLDMVVPIRRQHAAGIKSRLNKRKEYAQRQRRVLMATEMEEAARELGTLREVERSTTGLVDNANDTRWFDRDMRLVNAWLLQEAMVEDNELASTLAEEHDPYFKTHMHFSGSVACLKSLLRPGTFHLDLLEHYAALPDPPFWA